MSPAAAAYIEEIAKPHPHRPRLEQSHSDEKKLVRTELVHSKAADRGWEKAFTETLAVHLSAESRLAYRLYRASQALVHCIEIDPERRGGVPVLKGTRFPVGQIIAQIADGDSVDVLVDEFELDGDSIRLFLRALSDFLARPISNEISSVRRKPEREAFGKGV